MDASSKAGWEAMLALLQGLGDLPNMRRDEMQGQLNSREWHEAQRIAALLAHLRPLAELIRRLGRAEAHPGQPPAPRRERRHARTQPRPVTLRETRLADAPGELKGIRQSDRIERMLSARRCRSAIRCCTSCGARGWPRAGCSPTRARRCCSRPCPTRRAAGPTRPRRRHRPLQRGPMLVCVDTSGSMRGAPENIAKAVVLEVLRVAQREQRACR